ncbi:helicase domain-containing protein [Rhizoctonia solani]|uniref:Helicase domain-containing protein n=1 Tax=Rhizoctonia solani TaxID=456999 RepID=A0A0K6G4Y7_9AGAM|nr:helicase domain-containing protein [Rhizoctonia solani]
MVKDCSLYERDLVQLAEDQLASYNMVMAARRIQARSAPTNALHQYFHRLLQEKRVIKYLTTSFDGLEAVKKRAAEVKVVRMHGDNRILRCCTPGCLGVKEKDVEGLDSPLLTGATLPCLECTQQADRPDTARRAVPMASSYYLRPAVQGSFGIDMLPGGKLRSKVVSSAASVDLLLIADISFQPDEIIDLAREIAEQVHGRYGGVVYIGPEAIRGRTTKYFIDFHLKMDVDECVQKILTVMDSLQDTDNSSRSSVDPDNDKCDLWFEIVNHELEALVSKQEPEDTAPGCYLCNLGLEECLLLCQRCGDYLCFTGPYPTSQTSPCVVLQVFRDDVDRPALQEDVDNFSCVHCWNHAEEGPYPHYVRPAPWISLRDRGQPAPRMVMVIYFLDQFWPQAKHLRDHVAGKWVSRGWSCHIEPVRLETLPEQGTILPNLSWEPNSYNIYIIYITHGISASKTYQVSPTTSYLPEEFIEHTLAPARNLVERARHSLAFLACCGHPFRSPQRVWNLQLWLNRSNLVDTIIGCLNEKFTPAFFVCFLGKLTTDTADDLVSAKDALECWLSDDIAVSHTDLVFLEKFAPPAMWLFSPFNSRPLGKELPHLLAACKCKREQEARGRQEAKDRKVWKVSHNAAHGACLNEVEVKISCSLSNHRLFTLIEMLPEAVGHLAAVLNPSERPISGTLYQQIQLFKQNLDAALVDQEKGTEYHHYCYYILPDNSDEELVEVFAKHHALLKATKQELKVRKKRISLATRNRKLRQLAIDAGLEFVGHTKEFEPHVDVYCMEANTHEKLDARKMLIRGIEDTGGQPEKPSGASLESVDPQRSVPPPAKDNPFGAGYVDTENVLRDKTFKILDHGTVYGFARAPDGTYSMVFAVQFKSHESLGDVEKEAVDVFVDFLPKAAAHAYEVTVNGAQNVGRKRVGHLYSVGWRPGTTRGEMVAVYAAQNVEDKHDPSHYIDLYDSQELVNSAWIVMQESLSPRAVLTTIDTLADTAVPMFGSQSSDIASHGPSLGSNMAASRHDQQGAGFANKMHVDRDMDSLPEYYGKVFAFGQWIHVDKEGRLVEKERIKQAIPDGLFVIPGYKVAFDLGAATVIKAIWRGGMDMHGTTSSTVDLKQGITRWGMSIQTNRGLNQRMRSGKGAIFGVHERLRQYYHILSGQASNEDEDDNT